MDNESIVTFTYHATIDNDVSYEETGIVNYVTVEQYKQILKILGIE